MKKERQEDKEQEEIHQVIPGLFMALSTMQSTGTQTGAGGDLCIVAAARMCASAKMKLPFT